MPAAPTAGAGSLPLAAVARYLGGYPPAVIAEAAGLIAERRLGETLRRRHPEPHTVRNDPALYGYVNALKTRHLRHAPALAKVAYDNRLQAAQNALGTHTSVSRVQGSQLKAKREIRIAGVFRDAPAAFLRMIVVHELAHLKERDHDRAFYALCRYMEPDYARLELDVRLWLTALELEPIGGG